MSAHRRHYMDLQEPARVAPQRVPPQPPSWMLAGLALLVLAVQLLFAVFPPQPPVVIQAIRTPEAQAFEIPPISAEEARIEGFRAGMATVAEEGCQVHLTAPIASQQ